MLYSINKKAIKMSFIQGIPGDEEEIVRQLESKCRNLKDEGRISDHHIMYGLGGFDIALFYETDDFDAYLTQEGITTGITKVTRYYCFGYDLEDTSTFFPLIKKYRYAGIRFFKINASASKSPYENEEHFFNNYPQVLKDEEVSTFYMGTLGWNETVAIIAGNDINKIASKVFWATKPKSSSEPVFKTQSYLCVSTDLIIDSTEIPEIPVEDNSPSVIYDTDKVKPIVYISAIPRYCNEIYGWWIDQHDKITCEVLGKDDFVVMPKQTIDLMSIVRAVIQFRKTFKNKILSTNTVISFRTKPCDHDGEDNKANSDNDSYERCIINEGDIYSWSKLVNLIISEKEQVSKALKIFNDDLKTRLKHEKLGEQEKKEVISLINDFIKSAIVIKKNLAHPFSKYLSYTTFTLITDKIQKDPYAKMQTKRMIVEDLYGIARRPDHLIYYDFDEVVRAFDEITAIRYSSLVASLNGMLQNQLVKESFYDIVPFSAMALARCKGQDSAIAIEMLANAIDLVCTGAELRSYGINGAIEDAIGQFTKMRGGIQRFLLAVEFIVAKHVNDTTKQVWEGFVNVELTGYGQNSEIITVPIECLWKGERVWPAYHETAHILVDWSNIADENMPAMKKFLIRKTYPQSWITALNEIAADVFTFLNCFFNDFEFYKKCFCSEYLKSTPQSEVKDVLFLLIRLYAVRMFKSLFVDNKHYNLTNSTDMYSDMLDFFDSLDADIFAGLPETRNKYFLAAEYCKFIENSYDWLQLLYLKSCALKLIDTPLIGICDVKKSDHLASKVHSGHDSMISRYLLDKVTVHRQELQQYLSSDDSPTYDFMLELVDAINYTIYCPNILKDLKLYNDDHISQSLRQDIIRQTDIAKLRLLARKLYEEYFDSAIAPYTPREDKLNCQNTQEVVESIKLSRVYKSMVDYPEAVIYSLGKSGPDFGISIAMMLTFANCHHLLSAKGAFES